MDAVFKKLQLKEQAPLLVVGAPVSFEAALGSVAERDVKTNWRGKGPFPFVLVFVRSCSEIAATAKKAAERLSDDGLLWFAYPKKSSKNYASDIGRDDSWGPLGGEGFEAVRQVAIDADWSALRFRRVEHIKSMKREPKRALTKAGKQRTTR